MSNGHEYDVVVIGSGFGGSTAALRLTEKGYRVAVLEAGRRFDDGALPKTSWDLRSFLWAPLVGCFGIQRMSLLKDVMVLSGAGVGGGSLVYGNTLYEPPDPFYEGSQWSHITDWRSELGPFFDLARRMLGVVDSPTTTPADEVLRAAAADMGVGHTFRPTPVGVFFGPPGVEMDDPYFGGAGPRRRGCIQCGECLTGCRHGAKNSLLKNYLYLAERGGAVVHPLTTATCVRPLEDGRYAIDTARSGPWTLRRRRRTFVARDVVFAAGTLGTQKLLHRMRDEGHLPNLSARLGELTRTNSEAILAARTFRKSANFSQGVAVSASFYPDEHTHVEGVRYGNGCNAMGLLATALVDGDRWRPFRWIGAVARHLGTTLRNLSLRHWSEQTIVTLVMQTRDNSITCYTRRGLFGRRLSSRPAHGEPSPTWIPIGNEAVRRIAARMGGHAFGAWSNIFNIPLTAHFLGGAPIGETAETGVIDAYHRAYGHPGLHVVDGAAVSSNLGVNPSLTITAQAERAMALWPNKGEPDPRPSLGGRYVRLMPVAPRVPAVPEGAPAALRFQ